MSFDYSIGVHENIMEIRDITAPLKSLKVEISKSFLVHFILNSLRTKYSPFKIFYNTHKEKWSVNELLTMCVKKKKRLKLEKLESGKKGKPTFKVRKHKNMSTNNMEKITNVFLCKKWGHIKKDCSKYQKLLIKKGKPMSLACHKYFFIKAPSNTWWIDFSSTIHNVNTM